MVPDKTVPNPIVLPDTTLPMGHVGHVGVAAATPEYRETAMTALFGVYARWAVTVPLTLGLSCAIHTSTRVASRPEH